MLDFSEGVIVIVIVTTSSLIFFLGGVNTALSLTASCNLCVLTSSHLPAESSTSKVMAHTLCPFVSRIFYLVPSALGKFDGVI